MPISLPVILRYLSNKPQLSLNQKHHYNIRNLIMSLNNSSIDQLKQQFLCSQNQINLHNFLWLMRHSLPSNEHPLLYYELVVLFEEIDIDCSNTIDWNQFLEYLSQSHWLAKEITPSINQQVLFYAFRQITKYRKHSIKKIVQMQRSNNLCILQSNNNLTFLNYQGDKQYSLAHVDPTKILALDYSEEERLFGVLLTNRNLCFIQDGQIQKNQGVIRSAGTEINIQYLAMHRLWALHNTNNTLQLFSSPKNGQITHKIVFHPHQHPLTTLKQLSNPQVLASSSLDGLIKLWHLPTTNLLIELHPNRERQGHQDIKGVKGIDTYNKNQSSYICSWMFTSQIFIWLPSLSLSKSFAGQLKGHLGLVTDCKFACKGQLVSIDNKNMVKVWNVQKFECLQHFTIDEPNSKLFLLKAKPYMAIYNKILDFYRVKTNSKADLLDEIQIGRSTKKNVLATSESDTIKLVEIDFSHYHCFLLILTSDSLRFVEINTGQLVNNIHPVNNQQRFTCMSLKSQRRVYIGTSLNCVYEYKIEDARLIKNFSIQIPQQQRQLKFLLYHQRTKILICVVERAKNSCLLTYDEDSIIQSLSIKQIFFDQVNLVDMKYAPLLQKIAIASADGIITLWDYDRLVIINRIEINTIIDGQINLHSIQFEQSNSVIVCHNEINVIFVKINEAGYVTQTNILSFYHHQKNNLVAASLTQVKITNYQLEQYYINKRRKENIQKSAKRIDFKIYDQDFDLLSDTCEPHWMLSLADNSGEIHFYSVAQLLTEKPQQQKELKGKNQCIKQQRIAHMRPFNWSQEIKQINCSNNLFNQQYSYIPNLAKAGPCLNYFYFHTQDNILHIVDPTSTFKAEWNLNLINPKMWKVTHNPLQQVIQRLKKTEQALKQIYQIDSTTFQIQFYLKKYLNEDQIEMLESYEQKVEEEKELAVKRQIRRQQSRKYFNKDVRHNNQMSKKEITTLNSIIQLSDAPTHNLKLKASKQNIFQRKYQDKERKRVQSGRKQIEDKIKKSLMFAKTVQKSQFNTHNKAPQFTVNKVDLQLVKMHNSNGYLARIQKLLGDAISKGTDDKAESVAKSISQQHQEGNRRSSVSGFGSRQFKITPQRSSAILQPRIKSSLAQFSKNFTQNKIEYNNFILKVKDHRGLSFKQSQHLQI